MSYKLPWEEEKPKMKAYNENGIAITNVREGDYSIRGKTDFPIIWISNRFNLLGDHEIYVINDTEQYQHFMFDDDFYDEYEPAGVTETFYEAKQKAKELLGLGPKPENITNMIPPSTGEIEQNSV